MKRRSRLGITLVETLVVVSIMVLLISLAFPVFQNVKWNVKRSRSVSQMRQIHLAIMLYANDNGADGALNLGLPPELVTLKKIQKVPDELFNTGGSSWKLPGQRPVYTWMPPLPNTPESNVVLWKEHVARTEGNPVIFIDETFNRDFGMFDTKSAFGIYYDGHVANRKARGFLSKYSLWE